jgi:pimeloyl-ACP methyl ester carboxylesterase
LSEAGCHVLRFDYYGSGDSAGDSTEGDIETWLENLGAAIEELKIMAGLQRVSLVGLRLGATLAAMTVAKHEDIESVVLWDPVVDGREYVAELTEPEEPAGRWRRGGRQAGLTTDGIEVSGFPLTHRMREGFEAIEDVALGIARPARVLLVVSNELDSYARLRALLDSCDADYAYEHIPSPIVWREKGDLGVGVMPVQILRHIVSWVP